MTRYLFDFPPLLLNRSQQPKIHPLISFFLQLLTIYLSSLIRSVIALHNLINNKLSNRDAEVKEEKEESEKEKAKDAPKEDKDAAKDPKEDKDPKDKKAEKK